MKSNDEVQNIIDLIRAIKDPIKKQSAIDQIVQLHESSEIENELTSESHEISSIIDKLHDGSKNNFEHHIICGDIRKENTLEQIRSVSERVDLIFTSPPYNADIEYDSWQDNLSIEEFRTFISQSVTSCDSVLRDGGRFVINIRDISIGVGSRYPIIVLLYSLFCEKLGYKYRGLHIWYKGREESSFAWGSFRSSANPSIIDLFEYVFVFEKSGKRRTGIDDIQKTDFIENVMGVWKIRPVKKIVGKDKKNILHHPCPFPEELARRVIKLYSNSGDFILDPFGGIASSSLGAIKAGRNSICVDISKSYCEAAFKRIKNSLTKYKYPFEDSPEIKVKKHYN